MSSPHSVDGRLAAFVWPLALAVATVVGALATTCMVPYVALGVMAAATLPRPRAVVTVGAAWFAAQALGFGLMHYPLTPFALAWGAALGVAALVATGVASLVTGSDRLGSLRLAAAFGAGFVAYEGLLAAFATVAGGLGTFTPAIVARIAASEGMWLVALALVHGLLAWRAPAWFAPRPALRAA